MIVYIAGGISGNLNPIIRNVCAGKSWLDSMNVFLAGQNGREKIIKEFIQCNFILQENGGINKMNYNVKKTKTSYIRKFLLYK